MTVCPNGNPHDPHTNPVYSCPGVPAGGIPLAGIHEEYPWTQYVDQDRLAEAVEAGWFDAFEDTGSIAVVADDNKPCDTCGKTHKPGDADHSEVL